MKQFRPKTSDLRHQISVSVLCSVFCVLNSFAVLHSAELNTQYAVRTIYVDDEALGLNDGSSWENAYNYLQDAISEAKISEKPVEILAAQGTYKPDLGANQTIGDYNVSFELINGVTLSGGYAGVTTLDPNSRDIELYQTILSGDLYNDDANEIDPNNMVNEPTRYNDNSTHVVLGSYTDETAVIDGFTIISGNACGPYLNSDSTSRGGGIYIEQGNPVISNCTFILNAAYRGGAIYNTGSDPNINNCRFIQNSANYFNYFSPLGGTGGAIFNIHSSPVIKYCEFTENFSPAGGGIYNTTDSNSVITNCIFTRNIASLDYGGGLFISESNSVVKDCNFYDNYATGAGGGIANIDSSKSEFDNCIFFSNHTEHSGGAIYNNYGEPNITNCIFTRNSACSKGGAFSNNFADPSLNNCVFTQNHSHSGGGFDNYYGNPKFTSCIFSNNSADYKAGAIQCFQGESLFQNCIFSGNTALSSGGAVFNTGGIFSFINCTLFGNFAQVSGHSIYNTSWRRPPENLLFSGDISFLNCIIWNGQNAISNQKESFITLNFSNIQHGLLAIDDHTQGLIWGYGNMDADPCFAAHGFWVDVNDPNIIVEPNDPNKFWIEGDYHLKSAGGHYDPNSQTWILDDVNSPCIDTGDPNSPYEKELLPNGDIINMGAYGGTPQASISPKKTLKANKEFDENEY